MTRWSFAEEIQSGKGPRHQPKFHCHDDPRCPGQGMLQLGQAATPPRLGRLGHQRRPSHQRLEDERGNRLIWASLEVDFAQAQGSSHGKGPQVVGDRPDPGPLHWGLRRTTDCSQEVEASLPELWPVESEPSPLLMLAVCPGIIA